MRRLVLTLFASLPLLAAAAQKPQLNTLGTLPFTILESNVAVFRVPAFAKETATFIRPTMQRIAGFKPRGLILDLRDNQGEDGIDTVHAILESTLPKGTPYMRYYVNHIKRLAVTRQAAVFKKSMPIIVLRNHKTVNEPDIVIYALQKIRRAGIVEFSPHRSALKRLYKQHARMDDFRPIKESVFFVTPDIRLIADEGAEESDVIPRSISFIRELSPWDEPKPVTRR